jgi:SAM-dependent methyltransferase
MTDGWDESAAGWIADVGDAGDFARRFVLDQPMLGRIRGRDYPTALDVGCGEGRFCRMMQTLGIAPIGIDPTAAMIAEARRRDPHGDYRIGKAEALEVADASVDLVVSYLSLIDIPDITTAIAEMARVLRPGGALLIANLNSFTTAASPPGWRRDAEGRRTYYEVDNYMDERADWVGWRAIRIRNWHRPLSTYMRLLLDAGLELRHFDEPIPGADAPADEIVLQRRVPNFLIMEWQKPTSA